MTYRRCRFIFPTLNCFNVKFIGYRYGFQIKLRKMTLTRLQTILKMLFSGVVVPYLMRLVQPCALFLQRLQR